MAANGYPPGHSGNPAGRPKGSRNKPKSVQATLEDFFVDRPDVWKKYQHPLEVLLAIASNDKEKTVYRISAANVCLQYILPKIPDAVKVTGDQNTPVEFTFRWIRQDEEEKVINPPISQNNIKSIK